MSHATAIKTMKERISSIDALRGIVMILMALDHARDFFSNFGFDPTNMDHTTLAMFFTRWITHFCMPVFIFLIGTSMAIVIGRGKNKSSTAFFLITRGLWMIIIDLTIISFAWKFNIDPYPICQALWAIGWGMIVLAGLIFLPKPLIFMIGFVIVAGHNALDGHEQAWLGQAAWLHVPTHQMLFHIPRVEFFLFYPLIPWVGVSALGYVFGSVFFLEKKQREHWLWGIGLVCIFIFIALRAINGYGEITPWSYQSTTIMTLLSFINCTKYPPSLCFLLMTLGPCLLLLILLERRDNAITQFLIVYGKVPFFYYIVHLYLLHILAIIFAYLYFGHAEWLMGTPGSMRMIAESLSPTPGYSLPVVLFVWIVTVGMLYPLCRWYGAFKARHKNNMWLSYL